MVIINTYVDLKDKIIFTGGNTVVTSSNDAAEIFSSLLELIPERDPKIFFAFDNQQVLEIANKPDTIFSFIYNQDNTENPIAGGILWRPQNNDPECLQQEHEGGDIDLECGTYLQIDNTVVVPEYRGYGLQRDVIIAIYAYLNEQLENYEDIVATVSPDNPASLINLLRCGFRKGRLVKRHGSNERYVLLNRRSE